MADSVLFQRILTHFPYEPSPEQRSAMEALAEFLNPDSRQRVFILRGYAGTGKRAWSPRWYGPCTTPDAKPS